jgi:hypothetical protein
VGDGGGPAEPPHGGIVGARGLLGHVEGAEPHTRLPDGVADLRPEPAIARPQPARPQRLDGRRCELAAFFLSCCYLPGTRPGATGCAEIYTGNRGRGSEVCMSVAAPLPAARW